MVKLSTLLKIASATPHFSLKVTSIGDNGDISIGTCFTIQNLQRITDYMDDDMDNDIYLDNTKVSLICLKVSERRSVEIKQICPTSVRHNFTKKG